MSYGEYIFCLLVAGWSVAVSISSLCCPLPPLRSPAFLWGSWCVFRFEWRSCSDCGVHAYPAHQNCVVSCIYSIVYSIYVMQNVYVYVFYEIIMFLVIFKNFLDAPVRFLRKQLLYCKARWSKPSGIPKHPLLYLCRTFLCF